MILFVFEGARREPMLFESIKYLFFDKETDTIVYSFGNNIYNLYKQIMELGTGALYPYCGKYTEAMKKTRSKILPIPRISPKFTYFSTTTFNINSFLWKRLIVD